ncbi:DMT family transporter [Bacillus solitudinis]|uniref:DMT family transporter n=1 Tax=Bacillus solitudinis TaxID=2014074 RepID=UPI000C2371D3|nr:DMT family transporter [Bacillus solitudinis]
MSKEFLGSIQITLAMLIIGSFIVVNKVITERFPVFLASELRMIIGGVILVSLLFIYEKGFPKISKRDYKILFVQSFLGVFMFSVLLMYGLKLTTAVESGIITSITPAIVSLISFFLLKERLYRNQGIGIFFALLGALIINVVGVFSNINWTMDSLIGNVMILGAVVGEGVFVTFGRLVSSKVSPLLISTMTALFGAVLFLPLAIYEATQFSFSSVSSVDWLLILYTGVVVTVIAVVLMNQGVKKIPGNSTAVFTAVMPLSAVVFSYFFLSESVYWYHFVGILCIITGILFIAARDSSKASIVSSVDKNNEQKILL